jgi:tetratricopeptide (TPR) repeat protein
MKCLAFGVLFGLFVITAYPQTNNPRPAAKRPPAAAPKLNEKAEWEKAIALTDAAERVAALKKFVKTFPRSTHLAEAGELLSTAEAGLGNERLGVSDFDGAVSFFKAAAEDAPQPVPASLFTDVLANLPTALYFRSLREAGLAVATTLARKAENDAGQLLTLANFYITIENGTEARRLAEAALKLDPNSSQAYQTLGLAERVDFQLEDSAAAYAKALELDPESLSAKRGLAEMDRSLGKSDEAVALYRQILEKDPTNIPAKTGLVLSMFEAGQRADAEAEMTKALDENPGNVMLLAGAAYWYAVHEDPARAVSLAQKAIESDPRFIWSHIALARGLLGQKKAVDAERVLLAARRYGNFPTLEYEIASARLAAGLYREAAEELSKSFTIKDGVVGTSLGGRVSRESKSFTELVGFERRASIFAPTAADSPENSGQLADLLQLKQELDSPQPNADRLVPAIDEFVRGDDQMKVHRQIYAASVLLEKKIGVAKALELAKAAPDVLDAGLKVPDPVTAVLASELYESRTIALARNEFINTPVVSPNTLSSILRGRIEDLTGWALYEADDAAQAAIHLRRAVGVLPADTAWWRSSNWRLGNALILEGKDAEALELYLKVYRSSPPDPVRYAAIETLYKKINGSTDGLEAKIGASSTASTTGEAAPAGSQPDQSVEAAATPSRVPIAGETRIDRIPAGVPVARNTPSPQPTPDNSTAATPAVTESIPDNSPTAIPVETTPVPTQTVDAAPAATLTPSPESTPVATQPQPDGSPTATIETPSPSPASTADVSSVGE